MTSRRIFSVPSKIGEAFQFCDELLGIPSCHMVEPGTAHWSIFKKLCEDANIAGPDVTDAWLAALAIETGCEWVTLDRGFARFSGLKWRAPAVL